MLGKKGLPYCVFLGNLPESELLVPTFRNFLSVPSMKVERIGSSETSALNLRLREINQKTQYASNNLHL